jgi:NADPH:quinone reductase-like Zn-dependent oxidoreductase
MPSASAIAIAADSARSRLRGTRGRAVVLVFLVFLTTLVILTVEGKEGLTTLRRMVPWFQPYRVRVLAPPLVPEGEAEMAATSTQSIDKAAETHPSPGDTMQAIVQKEYGTSDTLHLAEIDRPTIGAGEVLVEVRAASLDRGTWHLMAGMPYAVRLVSGLRAPKRAVPGLALAGVVATVGKDVTRFVPGDEVFGIGKGSLAEFAAAPEDKLARKPSGLSFDQAAALSVSAPTALRGLSDVGRLEARQHVLIIGASGGVGAYAVLIAKALDAEVTAVCSTAKIDLVRSLGADHVIDYTRDDFTEGEPRYDLILDIAGNTTLAGLRRVLTPRGTLVIVGGENGGRWLGGIDRQLRAIALSPFVRQRLTMLTPNENHSHLENVVKLLDGDRLAPVIERTYSLRETPAAMRHLEGGHARGKLVIAM